MPDADTMAVLVEFLKAGGGWALSVVLMVAIVCLYRSTGSLLEERNKELRELLGECKTVIAENGAFMDRMEDATDESHNVIHVNAERLQANAAVVQACTEQLRITTDILQRVKLLLEDLRR